VRSLTAIISSPLHFNVEDLYVNLRTALGSPLFLKCEGFNFAGSIKLKAALEMVQAGERTGDIRPGRVLVESSSGNMGVALSLVAASRGYHFICVTDVRCTPAASRMMAALGAEVHVVTEIEDDTGLLGARLAKVRELCAADPRCVWLNQYANAANWTAHYRATGPAIAGAFPHLDVLFVGAGTTGTLMGCARYFREHEPRVRIVAVDSVGSVTFGGSAAPRLIPGLGTSVQPPIADASVVDDVLMVTETDTVRMCRRLARRGFVFGGSTGTVVSGAVEWLRRHDPAGRLVAVAVSPDLGGAYLDTLYDDAWVRSSYAAMVPA
jgi:2,3-diaminopropionate biosynthesis protein SbnA